MNQSRQNSLQGELERWYVLCCETLKSNLIARSSYKRAAKKEQGVGK